MILMIFIIIGIVILGLGILIRLKGQDFSTNQMKKWPNEKLIARYEKLAKNKSLLDPSLLIFLQEMKKELKKRNIVLD